jgi:hypothetical protein
MEASQVPLISELFTLPADPNASTGTFCGCYCDAWGHMQ